MPKSTLIQAKPFLTAILALAAMASPCYAQRGSSGHGSWGGGGGWGGGGRYYGGRFYGGGFGYYGYGYGYGLYAGDYPNYYGPDYYYGAPPYPYANPAPYPPPAYPQPAYPPPGYVPPGYPPASAAAPAANPAYAGPSLPAVTSDNTAMIDVRIPEGAELWFGGYKTSQTGPVRTFTTPALTPGKSFTYDVRATWLVNGVPASQTRTVQVEAGKRIVVDFVATVPMPRNLNEK